MQKQYMCIGLLFSNFFLEKNKQRFVFISVSDFVFLCNHFY